ncbi:MAG: hypothetical protein V4548_12905 [Bacteroidota bacterium]
MTDQFKPPIKTRTTEELLAIVGAPKKWNPDAVRLAKNELTNRNVQSGEIEKAVELEKRNEALEKSRKANKSYTIADFIFRTKGTLFELLFIWELKKDGYTLKAEQQKTFRIVLLIIIIITYSLSYIMH